MGPKGGRMSCPYCHGKGYIAWGSIEADICGCDEEEEDTVAEHADELVPRRREPCPAYDAVQNRRLEALNQAIAEIQKAS